MLRLHVRFFFCFFSFFFLSPLAHADAQGSKKLLVLGWLEEAALLPYNFQVHAKLDTGADTSSIHAENIEIYMKEGKERVRFDVSNRSGERLTIDKKVRRHVGIKRKKGRAQRRPVVRLGVCVGGIFEAVEFSLVDRSNFSSAALVGRNFLSGKILVDAADSYTSEPECAKG